MERPTQTAIEAAASFVVFIFFRLGGKLLMELKYSREKWQSLPVNLKIN